MRRPWSLLPAALLALLAGGTLPAVAQDAPAPLAEAVTFAPPGASSILFTDWAASKAAHGYADVTSATPEAERTDAMIDLGRLEAPFAAFGLSRFVGHAEAWGWDTTDLDWEASIVADGPPVAVLRLRDGFDLAPVIARFDERGFTTTVHGDAIIRSHPMDPSADWFGTTDLGVVNTAFVDDGRTLVLSGSVDAVRAALDARDIDFFRAPPAWLVAATLGAPLSAAMELGIDACRSWDPRGIPGDDGANSDLIEEVGPLRPWEAMGLGTFRDAAGAATARLIVQSPAEADALADAGGRARLADAGFSLRTREPYATSVFRLTGSGVDGASLTLDLAPVDDRPQRLQSAFFSRDLLPAMCG